MTAPYGFMARRRAAEAAKQEERSVKQLGALFALDTANDTGGPVEADVDLFADDMVFDVDAPLHVDAAKPEPMSMAVLEDGSTIVFGEQAEAFLRTVDVPTEETLVTSLDRAKATLQLHAQAEELVPKAQELRIADPDSCLAGELVFDALRAIEQAIHAHYDPHCDRAYKAWKGLTDQRGEQLKPVEAARKVLGDRIAAWKSHQKQLEQQETRQREQRARDEQLREAQRTATQLERQGDVAAARQVVEEAKVAPTPIVPAAPSAVPTTGKTVTRTKWEAVITDLPALLKAIGDRSITEFDIELATCLQPLLNRQAGVLKGELGKRYPGTEGRQKATLAGR